MFWSKIIKAVSTLIISDCYIPETIILLSVERKFSFFFFFYYKTQYIYFRDSIHNISIESFRNTSIYTWTPQPIDYDDCIMKSVNQVQLFFFYDCCKKNLFFFRTYVIIICGLWASWLMETP